MRVEEFRTFLTKRYRGPRHGRPLASKVAGDMLSRCRRVEDVLGINLDTALARSGVERVLDQITDRSGAFALGKNVGTGVASLRGALRLYGRFLGLED